MRWLAVLLCASAGMAQAEGAARVLDCAVIGDCNATGACRAGTDRVLFRLEPDAVAADGSGRFTISHDGLRAPMQALGDAGPFLWSDGPGAADSLLASGGKDLLWHHRGADGVSRIRFLTCEVTQ